ncbi:hypothetical protein HJG60_010134 [Phyllostomus discolor]|uniref:Uncharacterized protein n=1 Tax=Phyllostomus discolor TaxID=89673 RepID=A0A834AZD8_9CHIR|nr:hypothetical protein HJG60_010134 [Phyllostomus discolor]
MLISLKSFGVRFKVLLFTPNVPLTWISRVFSMEEGGREGNAGCWPVWSWNVYKAGLRVSVWEGDSLRSPWRPSPPPPSLLPQFHVLLGFPPLPIFQIFFETLFTAGLLSLLFAPINLSLYHGSCKDGLNYTFEKSQRIEIKKLNFLLPDSYWHTLK